MRARAPWLPTGGVAIGAVLAATVGACSLSTEGLGVAPGHGEAPGEGLDAAGSADVAAPPDDATAGTHHAADGSVHRADAGRDGSEPGDAQEAESTADAPGDDGESPGDAGPGVVPDGGCTTAAGCYVVPSGWSLVAFASSQTTACPAGYDSPANLVEGPDAAAACSCSACSVTAQPSCASGEVDIFYDTVTAVGAGTCSMPGMTPMLTNDPAGSCGNVANGSGVYAGNYSIYDLAYTPPPASGGTCSAPGAATGSVTFAARDRACVPTSPQAAGCVGSECTPGLSAPYDACIMQAGSVACPAGPFGVQHLAGTGVSFGCAACGCSISAACSGTITLYTDTACRNTGVQVPADGSCNRVTSLPHSSTTYVFDSYTYLGNAPASVSCMASGSSTAESVALSGAETICCAQ